MNNRALSLWANVFYCLDTRLLYNRAAMTNQAFPEPTVRILIFNPRGEMLLTKSHKWNDKYVIPGGHIELGESGDRSRAP